MSIVLEAAEMALHMYLVYLEQRSSSAQTSLNWTAMETARPASESDRSHPEMSVVLAHPRPHP